MKYKELRSKLFQRNH